MSEAKVSTASIAESVVNEYTSASDTQSALRDVQMEAMDLPRNSKGQIESPDRTMTAREYTTRRAAIDAMIEVESDQRRSDATELTRNRWGGVVPARYGESDTTGIVRDEIEGRDMVTRLGLEWGEVQKTMREHPDVSPRTIMTMLVPHATQKILAQVKQQATTAAASKPTKATKALSTADIARQVADDLA